MSSSAISETFGVNRTTIYRRILFGMNTDEAHRFSDIPDADLDTIITSLLHYSPNAGETYVQGSLRARGIKVQRWQLQERLQVIQTYDLLGYVKISQHSVSMSLLLFE